VTSCGFGQHRTDKVSDAEYRCWRCGADQAVMEREDEDAYDRLRDVVGFTQEQADALVDAGYTVLGWVEVPR
jgi:hypothetical protein